MFQNAIRAGSESLFESIHGVEILPPAPKFDSETGVQVSCQDKNVCAESSENSIYLMQNLRIGNSDRKFAKKEKLQLISSNSTAFGVIGAGSVVTEYGNFRFNLGPREDGMRMRNVTAGFGKYEIGQEFKSTANSVTTKLH